LSQDNKSYTVKDIADILKISKPTVRKYLSELSEEVKKDNYYEYNRLYISENCFKEIEKIIGKSENNIEKAENNAENLEDNVGKVKNNTENSENSTGKLESALEQQITFLSEQIKEKDKQLAEKDKQIDALTTALNNAQENNKSLTDALVAAQTLHAATIQTTALVDKSAEPKPKWWEKIFKKNS